MDMHLRHRCSVHKLFEIVVSKSLKESSALQGFNSSALCGLNCGDVGIKSVTPTGSSRFQGCRLTKLRKQTAILCS